MNSKMKAFERKGFWKIEFHKFNDQKAELQIIQFSIN